MELATPGTVAGGGPRAILRAADVGETDGCRFSDRRGARAHAAKPSAAGGTNAAMDKARGSSRPTLEVSMESTLAPALPSDPTSSDSRRVTAGFRIWVAAACAFALSGVFTVERGFLVPATVLGTVTTLVSLYLAGGALRRVADRIEMRALVLFHSIRAPIGVGFFVLHATSGLDATFTRVAGWGDLLVGLLVPLAVLALPSRPRLALAWNALAFVDIIAAFFTAQRALLFSGHPESMGALLSFPGPLLPFVIVPLVITTHLLLFKRLR